MSQRKASSPCPGVTPCHSTGDQCPGAVFVAFIRVDQSKAMYVALPKLIRYFWGPVYEDLKAWTCRLSESLDVPAWSTLEAVEH